jgi:hypothetical protein
LAASVWTFFSIASKSNAGIVAFCPNCDACIEKNEGCNHMTCTKCGNHWCWECRKNWDEHLGSCNSRLRLSERVAVGTWVFASMITASFSYIVPLPFPTFCKFASALCASSGAISGLLPNKFLRGPRKFRLYNLMIFGVVYLSSLMMLKHVF